MFEIIAGALASGVANKIFGDKKKSNDVNVASDSSGGSPTSGFAQFADLGDGFGDAIKDAMSERVSSAFMGLPQPGDGKGRGKMLREFMQEAYPGTNAWEQLGAAGGGSAGAAVPTNKLEMRKLRTQERIAEKQIQGQQAVAQIQADATRDAAATPYDHPLGAENIQAGIAQTRQAIVNLKSEKERIVADTLLKGVQRYFTQTQAGLAAAQTDAVGAQAGLTRAQTDTEKARPPLLEAQTATEKARPSLLQAQAEQARGAANLARQQALTEPHRRAELDSRDWLNEAHRDESQQRKYLIREQRREQYFNAEYAAALYPFLNERIKAQVTREQWSNSWQSLANLSPHMWVTGYSEDPAKGFGGLLDTLSVMGIFVKSVTFGHNLLQSRKRLRIYDRDSLTRERNSSKPKVRNPGGTARAQAYNKKTIPSMKGKK